MNTKRWMTAGLVLSLGMPAALGGFEVEDTGRRIEVRDGGKTVFGWQYGAIEKPVGGEKFAASAFVHPLATPGGFVLTDVQPADHFHHLGVWWPWKLLTVKGANYVTWELQKGEGRHVGVSAKVTKKTADVVVLEVVNRSEIKPKDATEYQPVLEEHATLRLGRLDPGAYTLDVSIAQKPVKGVEVEVAKYRYSGFAWRGPEEWTKDTSRMRTSGGHDRDSANHQAANWVVVDGKTPSGKASMLIMSGAATKGGTPELLRVWNSKMHHGMPFVNFNPVVKETIPMTAERREVAARSYRLVAADREIGPEEAERMWKAWAAGGGE